MLFASAFVKRPVSIAANVRNFPADGYLIVSIVSMVENQAHENSFYSTDD